MKKILFTYLLLSALFACQTDNGIIEYEEVTEEYPVQVLMNTTIVGKIVNDKGLPIRDCEIKLNDRLAFSNEEGLYSLIDVGVDSLGQMLEVSKDNYETIHLFVKPVLGNIVTRDIVLKPSTTKNRILNSQNHHFSTGDIAGVLEAKSFPESIANLDVDFIVQNGDLSGELPFTIQYLNKNERINGHPELGLFLDIKIGGTSVIPSNQSKISEINLSKYFSTFLMDELVLVSYDKKSQQFEFIQQVLKANPVIEINANVFYLLVNEATFEIQKFSMLDNGGRLIMNQNYWIVEEGSNKYTTVSTNYLGEISIRLNPSRVYKIVQRDVCGNQFVVVQKLGSLFNQEKIVNERARLLSVKISECNDQPANLMGVGRVEIITTNFNSTIFFQNNTDNTYLFACENSMEIVVKDQNSEFLRKIILSDLTDDIVLQAYNTDCTSADFSYIMYGDKRIDFRANSIYIFSDPVGSNHLTISDFDKLFINVKNATTVGDYLPFSVSIFNASEIIECYENCTELTLSIKQLGAKDEDCLFTLEGQINGEKIKGYIKDKRYN